MVDHVYKDIANRFPDKYVLAPVSAIVDPVRYQAIYQGIGEDTFPDYTSYMFKKQLEEADLLIVNKKDLLDESELASITAHVAQQFPGIPVVAISALHRDSIDAWAEYALTRESGMIELDIDMDYVMDGAERMGWYNKVTRVDSESEVDYGAFGRRYLQMVRDKIREMDAEIAHLKVIATRGDDFCKTALTTRNDDPMTVGALSTQEPVTLNVNVRAILPAPELRELMDSTFADAVAEYGLRSSGELSQSFASSMSAPASA